MTKVLVNIDVPALPEAVDFYTRAFGLTVGRRFGPAAVELLGAEAPIYLLVKAAGTPPWAGATEARTYERHWTPVHLDFAVDDLDEAVARARAAGATQEGAVEAHQWGLMALMSDPFGNGFCLLQLIGSGYDEIATITRYS